MKIILICGTVVLSVIAFALLVAIIEEINNIKKNKKRTGTIYKKV
ncbi:MAG TPA: hypothetical protein VFL70_05990 [Bacteroidia bacterium]|nr:hypothetical protein [Bacteroidia bacterium]